MRVCADETKKGLNAMADVVLEGVTKKYDSGKRPAGKYPSGRAPNSALQMTGFGVEDLSLRIADREFLVLVGPSGCGKSTTLRLIAGLETLTAGRILIGGRVVDRLPPAERDIAMVFQNYALYPHMTVEDNLAFGLRLRYGGGISARLLRGLVNPRRAAELAVQRRTIGQRVRQAAERLGISHLLDRKPHELSGGERQRVALGRAIVRDPAAFLFDEPLSNLDAKLRQQMRSELKQLHESLGATTIYVTHDQVEAMTLGQRVAVLDRGRLQQIGSPQEIYDTPTNLFVAQFFGSTPINLLSGELVGEGAEVHFVSGPCRWRLGPERSSRCRHWPRQVTLGIRGEDLHPLPERAGFPGGQVEPSQAAGDRWRFPPLTVRQLDNWGDAQVVELAGMAEVGITQLDRSDASLGGAQGAVEGSLVAKLAGELPVQLRRGERLLLELAVDRGHWFDSTTGGRLQWLV